MMRTLRSWKRESRLLLIIAELSGARPASALDVMTVDFLLQHPSLLRRFVRQSASSLPSGVEPSAEEAESSEETLLRWKRSLMAQVVSPMLGRLIARGLVAQSQAGDMSLLPHGRQIAGEIQATLRPSEVSRVQAVARQMGRDRPKAREWLRAALVEESS
jgi:hypothetical protein